MAGAEDHAMASAKAVAAKERDERKQYIVRKEVQKESVRLFRFQVVLTVQQTKHNHKLP